MRGRVRSGGCTGPVRVSLREGVSGLGSAGRPSCNSELITAHGGHRPTDTRRSSTLNHGAAGATSVAMRSVTEDLDQATNSDRHRKNQQLVFNRRLAMLIPTGVNGAPIGEGASLSTVCRATGRSERCRQLNIRRPAQPVGTRAPLRFARSHSHRSKRRRLRNCPTSRASAESRSCRRCSRHRSCP